MFGPHPRGLRNFHHSKIKRLCVEKMAFLFMEIYATPTNTLTRDEWEKINRFTV